jgi:hypothetical protein
MALDLPSINTFFLLFKDFIRIEQNKKLGEVIEYSPIYESGIFQHMYGWDLSPFDSLLRLNN